MKPFQSEITPKMFLLHLDVFHWKNKNASSKSLQQKGHPCDFCQKHIYCVISSSLTPRQVGKNYNSTSQLWLYALTTTAVAQFLVISYAEELHGSKFLGTDLGDGTSLYE